MTQSVFDLTEAHRMAMNAATACDSDDERERHLHTADETLIELIVTALAEARAFIAYLIQYAVEYDDWEHVAERCLRALAHS